MQEQPIDQLIDYISLIFTNLTIFIQNILIMKAWQVAAILLLTAIPLVYYSSNAVDPQQQAFKEWMTEFGFTFSNEEEAFRKLIFVNNFQEIVRHNADQTQTYKKGLNQFTHLSKTEFKAMFTNKYYTNYETTKKVVDISTPVLQEIDWQALGKVSAV